MPLVAAAGGIVITLLLLGNMSSRPVSACGYLSAHAAPSAACTTLAEGYPFHYLSTSPSVSGSPASISVSAEPVVSEGAAAEDLAIWAAVSFLACYMIWLPSRRPTRSAATSQPVPA